MKLKEYKSESGNDFSAIMISWAEKYGPLLAKLEAEQ